MLKMYLGKISGTRIKEGLRLIKAICFGNRAREAYQATQYGIDGNPTNDYVCIYANTENDSEPVIVGVINKNAVAESGGLRLYSENGLIYLRNNGDIEIGGSTKHFVKYEDLVISLNNQVTAINTQLSTISGAIGSLGGAYVPVPVTIDITNTKTEKIKTD